MAYASGLPRLVHRRQRHNTGLLFFVRTSVTDTSRLPLPDRLALDPRSPHHVPALFEQQVDIGILINGKERFDVQEYCVSEGWIKVPAGKTLDRRGRPLLIMLKGSVEVFYK